jgi:hypothetical protein
MEKTNKRLRDDGKIHDGNENALGSLSRPISPPKKKARPCQEAEAKAEAEAGTEVGASVENVKEDVKSGMGEDVGAESMASPWQLTWIRDLPDSHNHQAITLSDLLGDPLISECWEFNYLHDVGFLMGAFDSDTRHLVQVHVVHGFWKQEDPQRQLLRVRKLYCPPPGGPCSRVFVAILETGR